MNKKGFTLIELLAVIIILGILMIIAIPSVTKYINDSRKSSYIDTAKELVGGARNVVNEGKLEMYSTDTTYYIPSSCIKTENGGEAESPYGKFKQAYIGVIYDGQGYKYYWISVDDSGQGVPNITPLDKLDVDLIESDLKESDIEDIITTTGIGDRSEIKILDCNKQEWERQYHLNNTTHNASEENGGGPANYACKPATSLHNSTICTKNDNLGCSASGQAGQGNPITYGTIVSGNPKPGDAYDCKVTIDGDYTERFYYIGTEGENTILIYYKNMNGQNSYAYDSSGQNWHGPRTAYNYLPDTSEWNNPQIIAPSSARRILTETGASSTAGGTIDNFVYNDKAARFLTYSEVQSACGKEVIAGGFGDIDNCYWLLENIGYYEKGSGTRTNGYWLESPRYDESTTAWSIDGNYITAGSNDVTHSNYRGVRPVITIKATDLG